MSFKIYIEANRGIFSTTAESFSKLRKIHRFRSIVIGTRAESLCTPQYSPLKNVRVLHIYIRTTATTRICDTAYVSSCDLPNIEYA